MIHSIKTLESQLKTEKYNLSILPETENDLKNIILLKIEDLYLAITCLNLVKNKINPFTNGAFKQK
jgi:hypothetical protein